MIEEGQAKDFDFILENYVGGGGWWQWKKILLMLPLHISLGVPVLLHVYAAFSPPHRCFIEGCDSLQEPDFGSSKAKAFLNFAVPVDDAGNTFLK